MQSLELDTEITSDHAIHLKLPEHVKAQKARVIVVYDRSPTGAMGNLDTFLDTLPPSPSGLDHGTIMARLNQERSGWD